MLLCRSDVGIRTKENVLQLRFLLIHLLNSFILLRAADGRVVERARLERELLRSSHLGLNSDTEIVSKRENKEIDLEIRVWD